ncbi:MAG: hypothetical protein AB7S70_04460 [Hyphomicrobium sp.]|uniref:hypothetical protein n=1 Tax=Hyphomicrobium sp. TaxID=82 RepID=UPI003D0BE0BE
MATNGKCKYCGNVGRLVDAHIIPKGFFQREADFHFAVLNMAKAERPRRSQKGIWDDTILCDECEARFAGVDDYAVTALLKRKAEAIPFAQNGSVVLHRNGGPLAYSLPWVDGSKIRLFALFVLWRAGVSSRHECKPVKLGPFEEKVRRILDQDIATTLNGIHVTLWWEFDPAVSGTVILPYRSKIRGVRLWNFCCGGYYFVVQTDSRPSIFGDSPNMLSARKPVWATSMSLLDHKEGANMIRNIRESYIRFGDPWKGRWKPPSESQDP